MDRRPNATVFRKRTTSAHVSARRVRRAGVRRSADDEEAAMSERDERREARPVAIIAAGSVGSALAVPPGRSPVLADRRRRPRHRSGHRRPHAGRRRRAARCPLRPRGRRPGRAVDQAAAHLRGAHRRQRRGEGGGERRAAAVPGRPALRPLVGRERPLPVLPATGPARPLARRRRWPGHGVTRPRRPPLRRRLDLAGSRPRR